MTDRLKNLQYKQVICSVLRVNIFLSNLKTKKNKKRKASFRMKIPTDIFLDLVFEKNMLFNKDL